MFLPWQPISALLVNGDPGTALLDWLMLWFFLPPAFDRLGRRGLAKLLAFSWVVGVLVGFALSWPGIALPGSPYLGLTCLTTALIVVFGLAMPQARILLFFVLPIRAIWIVWVEIFLLALYFLAYRSLESAVNLAGVLAAFAWMRFDGSPSALLLRARLAWRRRRRTQARGRFDVIEGGRGDSSGWVH
jgi:membrane associated rhomboid family serine protease